MNARAIGVMRMRDDKGIDDKIIAVSVNDPVYQTLKRLDDIPEHKLREIQRFFEHYKARESKEVVVEGIHTNVPLHQEIFQHSAFRTGGTDIHYLENRLGLK